MEEKGSNREEHRGVVLTGTRGGLAHLLHLVAVACFCWSVSAQPCLLVSARREGGTGRGAGSSRERIRGAGKGRRGGEEQGAAGRGSKEQEKAVVGERSREQQGLGRASEEQNLVAAEYGRSRERAQNYLGSSNSNPNGLNPCPK
jgi:hypothetical protein